MKVAAARARVEGIEHCRRPGCHPARPLCRAMRRVRPDRAPCGCLAYPFPHRHGSGSCGRPVVAYASASERELVGAHLELAELRARWRSGERSSKLLAEGQAARARAGLAARKQRGAS